MAERTVPLFSIGAVARMLELSAATIRTWETRYGLVVPQRSEGGQRLYSRDQVDQLRFVKDEVDAGAAAGRGAPAARRACRSRRLLRRHAAARAARGEPGRCVDRCSQELLGTEGFEVLLASDPATAGQAFDELEPAVVVDRRRRRRVRGARGADPRGRA